MKCWLWLHMCVFQVKQVPQQYRNCWDIVKVLYHWWLPSLHLKNLNTFEEHCNSKRTICVHTVVLLMCCFFDYIFKRCIEVCIWSYSMEECRPTSYNIQLPTCCSLWKKKKKEKICGSFPHIKSSSFLCALYDQRI